MRKQVRITTGKSKLHIRSGPGISYKIVGYLYNGNEVIVDKMKTTSNGQVWYRIENSNKWIAKNDPVKKEDNYFKVIKNYEESSKTEKVKDKELDDDKKKPKEKAPKLPEKKETDKNKYTINKNMDGETVLKYGDNDSISLGSKMKSSSNTNSVSSYTEIPPDDDDAITSSSKTSTSSTSSTSTSSSSPSSSASSTSSSRSNSLSSSSNTPYVVSSKSSITKKMVAVRRNLSIGNPNKSSAVDNVLNQMFTQFNRWNMAFPDYHLARTHTKIFFTRPDLNIMTSSKEMHNQAKIDPFYSYIYENQPNVIKYLTKYASSKHQFNPMISNNPKSFEISDEYIKTVEAGETYTGYKIFYGRNDIESKAAGEISINYIDDRNLDIYKMHKVWVDYISKVYRGEFSPKIKYKHAKVLDYAVSVYYFVLAQDGETILFWSKFTGVFPTNTSSSTFSWDKDTMTKMPEISIKYVYSFKRDLDPTNLAEFNTLSSNYDASNALRTYEPSLLGMGPTWSGAPFVVTGKNGKGHTIYKLKFRPTS